jgi:hypothetical protein
MSSGEVGLLPAASDDIAFIESTMVAKTFEVVEVFSNFGQLEATLDAGFDVEMRFGLGGVRVRLLIGVDHPVVGDAKVVNIGHDAPIIELVCGILDEGVGAGVSCE